MKGAGLLIVVVAVGFIAWTAFTDKMMGRQVLTRAQKEEANRPLTREYKEAANEWRRTKGLAPRYKL